MVAMAKKVKSFQIAFAEPCKSFYCGGDSVSGRVQVEVSEVTRVSAVTLLALGRAKVEYAKGKQRCREEAEYLRLHETLRLEGQPTGTGPGSRSGGGLGVGWGVQCSVVTRSLTDVTQLHAQFV